VLARAIGALDEVDRGKADGAPAAAPPLLTLESMGEIDAAFGLPDVGLIVEAVGAGAAAALERGDDTHWSIRAVRAVCDATFFLRTRHRHWPRVHCLVCVHAPTVGVASARVLSRVRFCRAGGRAR